MNKKAVIIAFAALFIIGAGIGFAAGNAKNTKDITTTKAPAENLITEAENSGSGKGPENSDTEKTTEPTSDEGTTAENLSGCACRGFI